MTDIRHEDVNARSAPPVRAVPTATRTVNDTSPSSIVQEAAFIAPRDAVRWGPIVAGLVTALSLFLLLSLLALGLGIAATDVANAGDEAGTVSTLGTIAAAAIGLLAFIVGGFVAGRTAAVGGRGTGALNGFLVWALGVTAILMLGAFGLGSLFGAAGDIFGQVQNANVDPSQVQVDPQQAADAIRNSALVASASLALPALAAALGGALGGRRAEEIAEVTSGR
jgi:hypothetical protein